MTTPAVFQGFKLSPQQSRLWRLMEQSPSAEAYRAECQVLIEGPLDVAALEAAFGDLVAQHEILRTEFQVPAGMRTAFQVILDSGALRWSSVDLSDLDPQVRLAAAEALWQEHRDFPADSGAAGAFSALLTTLSPSRHLLYFSLPSLCTDMVSLALLVGELASAYEARLLGRRISRESVQYADITEALNELLAPAESSGGSRYWRDFDSTSLDRHLLAGETRGEREASFAPRSIGVSLPRVHEVAGRLAASLELSPTAVLLAAWQALLGRLTGLAEVTVGAAVDGRTFEELRDAQGLLVRSVPVAARLSGGVSFADLARGAAAGLLQAREGQNYFSLEDDRDGVERFFPFAFEALERVEPVASAGAVFTVTRRSFWADRFTVRLVLIPEGMDLAAELQFDANRLELREARLLLDWWQAILADLGRRGPEIRYDELRILGPSEAQQLLREANDTERSWQSSLCLHEPFELWAERAGERPVLEAAGRQLSYGRLNAWANRIARRLVDLGVGPDVPVGICAERSPEMVAGVLAILKAGGAYVPLDPDYPIDRLRFMLEDCGAAVLLAHGGPALEHEIGRPLAVVPLAEDQWLVGDGSDLDRLIEPSGLAYIIYTSGSTGRPKGVMMPHRAIANRLLWMQQTFPLREEDRVLQKTPFSFDASIWEIFLPLWAGSRLLLARPGGHRDPEYLVRAVVENAATVLQGVPPLLRALLEQPGLARCASLRLLFSGGEALPAAVVHGFRERTEALVCNLYGPTEAAIDATFHVCADEPSPVVPIGRPLANVQVFLLDSSGQPAPRGVAGEIHIAGSGLARGYAGRPGLTAERFLPDSLSGLCGQRLYRTGDLALWDEAGVLRYLGRTDQQVKLRGFRIELGEIESVLCRQPRVRSAVVTIWRDEQGESRLIAYFLGLEEGVVNPVALRRSLERELPEFMVPSLLVEIAELPLTPNGKVDRAALPLPSMVGRKRSQEGQRTPVEEVIAGIWCDVLAIDGVGVEEDFFSLGGHSLLVTRVMLRVREAFAIQIAIRDLFDAPTVAALAGRVEELRRTSSATPALPPLQPSRRDRPLPLSFAQQRLWFIDRLEPASSAYNIPAALRLEGLLDIAALTRAFGELLRRHEVLRTAFVEEGGEPLQVIAAGSLLPVPVVDLADLAADVREGLVLDLARAEQRRPFALDKQPLLRILLLRCGADEHVVLATMHHIVSDGWSIGIMIDEVTRLYEAFCSGAPSPLPPLPLQYADYAIWQRSWLTGEVLEAEISYWRDRLAGAPPVLELPTDRPRPRLRTLRGADHLFAIPPALAAGLRKLARTSNATLFMVLLTAFKALLSRYADQPDLVVGTPFANRTRLETERLIGFFLNTLVLRTDLRAATFTQALARAREVALSAYAHQEVPFEKLVEALHPERDLSRTPLFQVLFNLQAVGSGAVEVGGLKVRALDLPSSTEKFDLTLAMLDGGELLSGGIRYSRDLFDRATMVRLARSLIRLLAEAAANPERNLASLPILEEAERHQLLCEWTDTATACDEVPLHSLFEMHAACHPGAVAVIGSGRQWTYDDLNRWANRWAHFLSRRGLRPEEPVGILRERSPEMVASALAVLKAGGAYMPLDPRAPRARLAAILERARPRWVFVQRDLLEVLPEGSATPLLTDEPPLELAEELDSNPGLPVAPEGLAYIIHTSGSTGIPKGVPIAHRGVVAYVDYLVRRWGLGPEDTVLNLAALTFDPSVRDLFGPLATGGRLIVVDPITARDPAALLEVIHEQKVTCLLSLVPSLLDGLVQAARARSCDSIRLVMTCGEALSAEDCARAHGLFRQATLVNQYGPTEGTMSQTYHPVAATDRGQVPVGRPIPNAGCLVLSAEMGPLPVGVPGEICIRSLGLARGYLAAPDMTAVRFVPDPFSDAPGQRLYRTGDRGRWLIDGNLEFLGRLDHQIKIRGFRVELGEIEAALARFPGVARAAVRVWDLGADRRLVGYVVADRQTALSGEELRAFLRSLLPEYMVPAAIVPLTELPLTRSGKVDRLSLPLPEGLRPDLADEYVPPRNAVEELVAGTWAEVLGLDRVGVLDDFFDLGGHSLLGMQVIHRLRDTFQTEVSVRDLFMEPTVAGLARELVKREEKPGQMEKIATVLLRVKAMSPEAVAAMLNQKKDERAPAA